MVMLTECLPMDWPMGCVHPKDWPMEIHLASLTDCPTARLMAYLQMERPKVMSMGFRWANQKGNPTDCRKAMKMDCQRA